jgi:hypothetical protein
MDAGKIGGKVKVLRGEIFLLRGGILHMRSERARSSGQPLGAEDSADGVKLKIRVHRLAGGIGDLKVDALILQIAADGTGDAVERLRRERQMNLRMLARSDFYGSRGGDVGNSGIKGGTVATYGQRRKF